MVFEGKNVFLLKETPAQTFVHISKGGYCKDCALTGITCSGWYRPLITEYAWKRKENIYALIIWVAKKA